MELTVIREVFVHRDAHRRVVAGHSRPHCTIRVSALSLVGQVNGKATGNTGAYSLEWRVSCNDLLLKICLSQFVIT